MHYIRSVSATAESAVNIVLMNLINLINASPCPPPLIGLPIPPLDKPVLSLSLYHEPTCLPRVCRYVCSNRGTTVKQSYKPLEGFSTEPPNNIIASCPPFAQSHMSARKKIRISGIYHNVSKIQAQPPLRCETEPVKPGLVFQPQVTFLPTSPNPNRAKMLLRPMLAVAFWPAYPTRLVSYLIPHTSYFVLIPHLSYPPRLIIPSKPSSSRATTPQSASASSPQTPSPAHRCSSPSDTSPSPPHAASCPDTASPCS